MRVLDVLDDSGAYPKHKILIIGAGEKPRTTICFFLHQLQNQGMNK